MRRHEEIKYNMRKGKLIEGIIMEERERPGECVREKVEKEREEERRGSHFIFGAEVRRCCEAAACQKVVNNEDSHLDDF